MKTAKLVLFKVFNLEIRIVTSDEYVPFPLVLNFQCVGMITMNIMS